MTTAARVVGISALVLVLAGGAYVTADAYDVVPGMVTLSEPPPVITMPLASRSSKPHF